VNSLQFTPGDRALVVNAADEFRQYVGTECVVEGRLEGEMRRFGEYQIRMHDGQPFAATAGCLERAASKGVA
jgi:hypothetical protein